MRIGVVIPTFNRSASVLRCLESLGTELAADDLLVVVDAGSTDGSRSEIARRFPRARLIRATPDSWWSGLVNIGVREALGSGVDSVLTFNDDNVATPGFLGELRRVGENHPRAICASVCCYLSEPTRIFFAGRVRNRLTDRFHYLDLDGDVGRLNGEIREVDLLHGMCTLVPRAVFDKVGLYDAAAFPHLFADDDLVLRARQHGYTGLVALQSIVLNDRTTTGDNPYDKRLGPPGVWRLLTSRRSVFQVKRRTRFLWRHRRSLPRFLLTLAGDYLRLGAVVLARWLVPEKWFRSVGGAVNRHGSGR